MNIFERYPRPWKFKQASFLATGTHEITCANGKDIQEIPYIYIPLGASTRFWDELVECVNESAALKQRLAELEAHLAQQPQNIADAVYYFANWKISAQDAQEWLNPTNQFTDQ